MRQMERQRGERPPGEESIAAIASGLLEKCAVEEIIRECKVVFGGAPEVTSAAEEAVEYVQQKVDSQPVLLTGPAACGKSTITKQYLHRTASEGAAGAGLVPVLVPVIELAKTMQEQSLNDADADILKAHLMAKHTNDAAFLLQMRAEHRLLVLLDNEL